MKFMESVLTLEADKRPTIDQCVAHYAFNEGAGSAKNKKLVTKDSTSSIEEDIDVNDQDGEDIGPEFHPGVQLSSAKHSCSSVMSSSSDKLTNTTAATSTKISKYGSNPAQYMYTFHSKQGDNYFHLLEGKGGVGVLVVIKTHMSPLRNQLCGSVSFSMTEALVQA